MNLNSGFRILLYKKDPVPYSMIVRSFRSGVISLHPINKYLAGIFIFLTLTANASASMINFDTYRMLDQGMSEGEIIYHAGPPDKEVYFEDPVHQSPESIKQYFYIPLPGDQDPHLTIITLENGIVIDIKRVQLSVPTKA